MFSIIYFVHSQYQPKKGVSEVDGHHKILERTQTLMKGDWKANNNLVSSWL